MSKEAITPEFLAKTTSTAVTNAIGKLKLPISGNAASNYIADAAIAYTTLASKSLSAETNTMVFNDRASKNSAGIDYNGEAVQVQNNTYVGGAISNDTYLG